MFRGSKAWQNPLQSLRKVVGVVKTMRLRRSRILTPRCSVPRHVHCKQRMAGFEPTLPDSGNFTKAIGRSTPYPLFPPLDYNLHPKATADNRHAVEYCWETYFLLLTPVCYRYTTPPKCLRQKNYTIYQHEVQAYCVRFLDFPLGGPRRVKQD